MQKDITFGLWLRQRRRLLDLTQQELAERAGCARITLRRIEASELTPSKQLAALLLTVVGIPSTEQEPWIRFARGRSGMPSLDGWPGSPPLSSTNLPAALTTFIGREKELAELRELLHKRRLVTLTGAGGVGKTRLSLEIGRLVNSAFGDGVWLVELAPLNDPALLPQTVAAIFGVTATPFLPVTEVLINFLRPKTTLLILDNCEHMVDACAHLADNLLKRCPNLALLTTSREALGILGEATYRVPSLRLPDPDEVLAQFREFAALTLFEERAQLVQSAFKLTLDNVTAVVQICSQLDGIPLAIELAAIHVNLFSPAEIARQLAQRFDLLAGGSRTALPRQQTIRASIDWSWDLLNTEEQILLQRLAIFSGGWTLESAHAVCSDLILDSRQIDPLVAQLVRKSLVMVKQSAGQETRYSFHEVVRQYALEKLLETGDEEIFRQRHIVYFVALTENAEPQLHSAEQALWLERLVSELPNLRAALEAALPQDPESATRIAAALGWFWFHRGLLDEGRHWLDSVLSAYQPALLEGPSPRADRAPYFTKALYGAGLLAHYQGDYAGARELLERSLAMSLAHENQSGVASALFLLGAGYIWQGDFATADKRLVESTALLRNSGPTWELAQSLNGQGFLLLAHGEYTKARSLLEEGLAYGRESGDRYGLSMLLANLGTLAYQQGDLQQGEALLEESLAAAREIGDPTVIGWATKELGHIARYQGDYARATELYQAVLEESRVAGLTTGVADMLRALGDSAARTGAVEQARPLLQESLALFQGQGDMRDVLYCLNSFAVLAAANNAWPLAVKFLGFVHSQLSGMAIVLPPIDRDIFDQLIVQARQKLDTHTFEATWHAGCELSMEQAIMLGLQ